MAKYVKLTGLFLGVIVTLTLGLMPCRRVEAQDTRSLVPYPRDILIETVDPETRMPRSSFCTGINTLDVKLTNNTGYRRYVSIINRDTRGIERTLYNGWVDPGQQYLSRLIQAQLEVTGPAGTESLRVDVNDSGRITTGVWMTFTVQECGGGYPPGGGYGAALWAQIYPYAIAQGEKGTITLQTNVQPQSGASYYFEILNSYGQLWKRLPVTKPPYAQYQVTLSVGTTTKPTMLTYTVNLWFESQAGGNRQKVATTQFSFRVITPGSNPTPYNPGYPGDSGMPYPGYSWPPTWNPYGDGSMSYPGMPYSPYPTYGTNPYGTGYNFSSPTERSLE